MREDVGEELASGVARRVWRRLEGGVGETSSARDGSAGDAVMISSAFADDAR